MFQEAQAISISLGSMVSPTTEPDDVLFEAGIKHEDPVPEIVAQLQRRSGMLQFKGFDCPAVNLRV